MDAASAAYGMAQRNHSSAKAKCFRQFPNLRLSSLGLRADPGPRHTSNAYFRASNATSVELVKADKIANERDQTNSTSPIKRPMLNPAQPKTEERVPRSVNA